MKMRTAIVLALAAFVAGCKEDRVVAPPVRPVLSVVATLQTSETLGPFAGSIAPRYSTAMGFRIFGRVIARDVDIGDTVKKGDRIAALDPAMQTIAVQSAQASVDNAQAVLVNAVAEEVRQRGLVERNFTPQAQFDVTQQSRQTAAANLDRANATLTKAKDALSYTELHADFDGVITERDVDVGHVVTAGQKIATLARPDVKDAVFDIPDAMVAALPSDAVFDIAIQLDPSKTTTGRVREVAPLADPSTRTRRIRVTLDNPPAAFRLGTMVAVLLKKTLPPSIVLPVTALLEQDGKNLVWVVDPATSKVAQRAIEMAARDDRTIAVSKGLAAGERVVLVGVHSLQPGQIVKIADAAGGGAGQ